MGKVFFTADTHLGHGNIIKHCNRPFAGVDEMDKVLLENINSMVGRDDTLYHLGDFARHSHKKYREEILCKNVLLVPGNHDDLKQLRGLVTILPLIQTIDLSGHKLVMCHYAMRTWDSAFHGSWHIFGHSHNLLPSHRLSFDVGVDCWNFKPLSAAEVIGKMAKLKAELRVLNNA